MRASKLLVALFASLSLFAAAPAFAQDGHEGHDHGPGDGHDHGSRDPHAKPAVQAAPGVQQDLGEPHAAAEGHADAEGHGEGHDAHAAPSLHDFNWFYGMVGESDVEEPSLLWRPKGMPIPFGAMALNSIILYFLLIRFAKKPIAEALKNRKATLLRGMEEAAKMKKDAEASLAEYQDKLANIDREIERVRSEMREAGERERVRILAEAREKRERMEREARVLIEQELKGARELLLRETVRGALRSAETMLIQKVTAADQQRLAEDYLGNVQSAVAGLRGKV
jgi:F-type H+-transporting ATPase subunit b